MKAVALALVLAIATSSEALSDTKQTFWQRLTKPTPKTIVKTTRRKSKPKPKSTATPTPLHVFIVDNEWMAHYWSLEADWDYYIPEDQDIRFKDGKWHVPPVVFRHLEDMMKAKKK